MISMDEILKGRAKLEDLDQETQNNLQELLVRINKLQAAYGKPLKVNDGYRRPQDTPKNGAAVSIYYNINTLRAIIPLAAGIHKIDIYGIVNANSAQYINTDRRLTVREL